MILKDLPEEDAIFDAFMRILAIRDGDIDMDDSVQYLLAFLDLWVLELREKHFELNDWNLCSQD